MASEYTCITRKIEVHLHKHGDSEEATQRFKDEFRIWDDINNNLYKAANRIVSHCFFNDTYEYRLKLHSPRLQEIEKLLSNSNAISYQMKMLNNSKRSASNFLLISKNSVKYFCVEVSRRVQIQSKTLHIRS